jgi:exosome complex RNA-binding protein Csl4
VKPSASGWEGASILRGMSQERTTEEREVVAERCDACGTGMYGLHCKLVCPNCGNKRDCSDP